ncbi:MAG: hypothetical protein EA398_16230 [Deltaproteobacteria bacterium]|nr:MAG: hypothetical protein EA398_16230 [Deltaproteobacteria bacterium]
MSQSLEKYRESGAAALARTQELKDLEKRIRGMEWGSGNNAVRGETFSDATLTALSRFVQITRAEPQTQVDILGGKPYLNVNYWQDLVTSHGHYYRHEQEDVSPAVEQGFRDQAKRRGALAKQLLEAGRKDEALDLQLKALEFDEKADEVRQKRAACSPPAWAEVVVITRIWRFINAAPLDKIKSGEVEDLDKYLVVVEESGYAGGMGQHMASYKKYDRVGDMFPGKTARSRSFRRCAVKTFAAHMEKYSREVERAEEYIEAEYEIIQDDPGVIGTSGGEVEVASRSAEVFDIPLAGEEPVVAEYEPEPEPAQETFDRDRARRQLFATLKAAGIKGDKVRKDWAAEHGFPRSTSEWTEEDYDRAVATLTDPVKEEVYDMADDLNLDLNDLCLTVVGKEVPEYLSDYVALRDHLRGGEL